MTTQILHSPVPRADLRYGCPTVDGMWRFKCMIVASGALLSACVSPQFQVSREGAAAPVSEAVGIFRFICETNQPEERLIFPFRLIDEASKTYRHTGFDMSFRVDDGCTMQVRVTEKLSETSDGELEVLKASGETFERRMSSAIPRARVEGIGDGYFIVSLP